MTDPMRRMDVGSRGASVERMEVETGYEFSPLNPPTGPVFGRAPAGMGCLARLNWHLRRNWVVILFATLLLVVISYLGSIARSVLQTAEGSAYQAVRPTLVGHETGFLNAYTSSAAAELLFFEFPAEYISGDSPRPILFSAIYALGTFDNDLTDPLTHMPAENTDETVFEFKLTEDLAGVDVMRMTLSVRTTDPGMDYATKSAAPSEWVATLPVMDIGTKGGALQFTVSAGSLLKNGFFITDVTPSVVADYRVKLSETRAYPRNLDLTVEYQLATDPDTEATTPLTLRFSVAELPEEPMQARLSDERVGYFTTAYTDLGDHRANNTAARASSMVDAQLGVINRRRMEKGGEPLKYYIDPSVPPQWRAALKKGVEAWQPAFEKIGYGKAAIRAVLPDDEDWPEDYDAGDIRYSSITWAAAIGDNVFAIGPSTLDPRSGEILRSDIVFTSGWIKTWVESFERYAGGARSGRRALQSSGGARPWNTLEHHPEPGAHQTRTHSHASGHRHTHHDHSHSHSHSDSHAHAGDSTDRGLAHGPSSGGRRALLEGVLPSLREGGAPRRGRGSLRHHTNCQYSRLEDVSVHVARLALALAPDGTVPDNIVEQGLTDVTMHEVGHTLGLRHNFHGSTEVTLQQSQDPAYTSKHGLTSSVMDYLPVNIVSSKLQHKGDGSGPDYFTPVIGEYDYWAIQYGYMEAPGDSVFQPAKELTDVASRALIYSTDEDGGRSDGVDPYVSVFDMGEEPLAYFEDRLQLVAEIRPALLDRAVFLGEPFWNYADGEATLLTQVMNAGTYAAKYIGGFRFSKQRRVGKDTAAPMVPLDPGKQRQALALVVRILTETGTFFPKPATMGHLVKQGGECSGLQQYCEAIEPYDVLGKMDKVRRRVLLALFTPDRIERLRLQSWGGTGDAPGLSVHELFAHMTVSTWGELLWGGSWAQDPANWELMLFYVDILASFAGGGVEDGIAADTAAAAAQELYRLESSWVSRNDSFLGPVAAASGLYRLFHRKLALWETGQHVVSINDLPS